MMSYNDILRAVIIVICISQIYGQYYDFFQAFQPFIQPPTSQPLNFLKDFTTARPRPRQKVAHEDNVRKLDKLSITDNVQAGNVRKPVPAEQSNNNKQTRRKLTTGPASNFFTTTQRTTRKTTKTPSLNSDNSQRKAQNRQESQNNKHSSAIIFVDDSKSRLDNTGTSSIISNPRENSDKRDRPKPRPNNRKTQSEIATSYESSSWYDGSKNSVSYYTTRPPYIQTTKAHNYIQNNIKNTNTNYYTTHNPLLNRPGVRPPVVNGPPITNRPISQRPNFEHKPQINLDLDLNVSPEVISGPDEDYMTAVEKKRYIEIAERMCDKYKSLSMKQVEAIPLLPSPQPVRVNVSSCAPISVPLVVGGKVVSVQEFPHMALLGWKKIKNRGISWKCGGSLLSNQFVLTAAHCAYQDRDDNVVPGPPRIIQLGSSYLNDPKAVFMKVASVTRHPKYKLPKAYYDLAIVKMAGTVTFSEKIKPACLGTPPPVNRPIIATGWGKTEFGSQSEELRSVSLPVWDISDCSKVLGVSVKLPTGPSSDSQICAGERSGGKDTCQGDSGGPAQIQDGCIWRVVAVTSVGRFCGDANTPAIYATVQRAFISAVVFSKEAAQNNKNANDNNRNKDQVTNNDQGYNDGNNKKSNGQSSVTNTNRSNSAMNERKQFNYPESGPNINYGNNNRETYNWNNGRDGTNNNNNYNQNNQGGYPNNNYNSQNNRPNRNEFNNNFNNYNPQTTEGYSYTRRENDYYNPSTSRETFIEGQFYNNYAGSNNYNNNRPRDWSSASNGRSEISNANIWWT